ncbi:MAG: triose-phosphate isomerase [Parachlamydiaceae bacterium]
MRSKVVIGNWKMNMSIPEARRFVSGLGLGVSYKTGQVGLAVPFTMIEAAAEAARGTTISIGGQNASDQDSGAFTGEISSRMLKDAGASFVLIGHSERRRLFHEDDAVLNKKIKLALAAELKPVFCIGETEEQSGKAHAVLQAQLINGLKGLKPNDLLHTIIAYEPVWAIGTGKTPTPEVIEEVHAYCRKVVGKEWGEDIAQQVVILYGGSANAENGGIFMAQPDVDGLLVGGASLSLESFNKILSLLQNSA